MKTPLSPITRASKIRMIENEKNRQTRAGNVAEIIANEKKDLAATREKRRRAANLRSLLRSEPEMKGKVRTLTTGEEVFQPRVKGKFGKSIHL